MTLRRVLISAIVLGVFSQTSCSLRDQPVFVEHRRPRNVPPDATLVSSGKGGWWKLCTFHDGGLQTVRCQVFGWRGGVLFDEEFLPYDGGSPVSKAELRITRTPREPIDYQVELENGRILLPKSRFKELKAFMDRLN